MNFIKEYNSVLFFCLVVAYAIFLYEIKIKQILQKKLMNPLNSTSEGSTVEKKVTEHEPSFTNFYPNLKNKKNWILILVTFLFVSCLTGLIYLKNFPIFEKGHCFTKNIVISQEPTEEWHKPFLMKKIEFIILKVGKKNYYVSTTIPSLDDFLISDDYSVEKSNCDIIFQRGQ